MFSSCQLLKSVIKRKIESLVQNKERSDAKGPGCPEEGTEVRQQGEDMALSREGSQATS